jgi:glutamyl-tRNA synthetase
MGLTPPRFGHMPLIMGQDGAKLSKRHGGVSVEEYKREGFLPEALVNYLLLLGWSPGGDREIIPIGEAVKLFDINDMKGVQAKFDLQKLIWMNSQYIAAKTEKDLLPEIKIKLADTPALRAKDEYLLKIIGLYKVRLKTLSEFYPMADYFFTDDYTVEQKGAEKYLSSRESKEILREFSSRIEKLGEFSHAAIEESCRRMAEEKSVKPGAIIHPTRVAVSGKTAGAGLFEIMATLGKAKTVERMKKAAS